MKSQIVAALTIGRTVADADNVAAAYRRFAAQNVGVNDVLDEELVEETMQDVLLVRRPGLAPARSVAYAPHGLADGLLTEFLRERVVLLSPHLDSLPHSALKKGVHQNGSLPECPHGSFCRGTRFPCYRYARSWSP